MEYIIINNSYSRKQFVPQLIIQRWLIRLLSRVRRIAIVRRFVATSAPLLAKDRHQHRNAQTQRTHNRRRRTAMTNDFVPATGLELGGSHPYPPTSPGDYIQCETSVHGCLCNADSDQHEIPAGAPHTINDIIESVSASNLCCPTAFVQLLRLGSCRVSG